MHTIYIKTQVIHIHELFYTFQQYISILMETLKQKNIKLNIKFTYTMLQINNGSYKYKFYDADILLNKIHCCAHYIHGMWLYT